MRIARSLEVVEGEEAGRGRQCRGLTQTRFPEEEASDGEAAWIAEQTLAKLGPDSRQSRDPKMRPPTPGPQRVWRVEREPSQPTPRHTPKGKSVEKSTERSRGRSPSADRSQSRNKDGPPQCKGYGHFMRDCLSNDFYIVAPNGLPIKKREASQERPKTRDGSSAEQT